MKQSIEEAIITISKAIDDHVLDVEPIGYAAKDAIQVIIAEVKKLKSEYAILTSFYDVAIKERDYERSVNRLSNQPSKWESDLP